MTHIELLAPIRPRKPVSPPNTDCYRATVHIVDLDGEMRSLLAGWLSAAGMDVQIHNEWTAFLNAPRGNLGECVVVDVQPPLGSSSKSAATPWPPTAPCPIVVTAREPHVAMVVAAMKSGATDFVEKPFREREVVAAILSATEADRKRHLLWSRDSEWRARFASLSRRERQVMGLVVTGRLNKQVAGDLSLSEITIKAHRGSVMRKMGARTIVELVRMADVIGEELAV